MSGGNQIVHFNGIRVGRRSPLCAVVCREAFNCFSSQISLHVLYCFLVKGALNFGSSLKIVEVLEEIIELRGTLLNIFDRHVSISVEIQTHPVVTDKNLHILIVLSQVLSQLLLMLEHNLHYEREHLCRAVVDHVQIALDRGVNSVIDELEKLDLVVPHFIIKGLEFLLETTDDVTLLDKLKCKLARMKPDIDELKAELLQFV